MDRRQLAAAITAVSRLTGEFRLRSGQIATEYFDKYQFEARPDLLRAITDRLVPLVPSETRVFAGLELGGVPIATALSLTMGLPAVFVRKAAKTYGTARLAEGVSVSERRVLVIEDVVTSGGQIIESVRALRAQGALIDDALCVIDREAGGAARLAEEAIQLKALFTRSELENTL